MKHYISCITFDPLIGLEVQGSLSKRVLNATGCKPDPRYTEYNGKWSFERCSMDYDQNSGVSVDLLEDQLLVFKNSEGVVTMRALLSSIDKPQEFNGHKIRSAYGSAFWPGDSRPVGGERCHVSIHLAWE